MKLIVKTLILWNLYSINNGSPVETSSNAPASCVQVCHTLSEKKINVHLIPHSHDDVGWVRTFNQYYYGSGTFKNQADAGVQYILNSTIQALKANSERKFIQVETAFFWKWWQNQPDDIKEDVINLVNSGQLEMINGGWSMNDEAAVNYQSTIDQFTWGFRILENTVGKCGRPKIGWQIDPFGHSREHASIIKQLGFDGLVIIRIDYRDKQNRRDNQNMDFIWKTSQNLDNSEIFTTMFPDHYSDEPGYRFDILYSDQVTDSNVISKVNGFVTILDKYTKYYKTGNIMIPMGNDFTYQVAERNFNSIDKLIKGFEDHETYNVFYSTPSCYIQAVKEEVEQKSISLTQKEDDFFPYADNAHRYWTGYFTSRPTCKRFERLANNILQSANQMITFSRIQGEDYSKNVINLREAIGIVQHHDAITGTAKQVVADNYNSLIDKGIDIVTKPLGGIIGKLLRQEKFDVTFSTCLLANVSICANTEQDTFLIAVYNPLARYVNHYVTLPVPDTEFKITGPDGEELFDIIDTIHSFDYLQKVATVNSKELVFCAKNVPPLGLKLYYVEKVPHNSVFHDFLGKVLKLGKHFEYKTTDNHYKPFETLSTSEESFGDEVNGFTIDSSTGKLKSVTIKGTSLELTQEFLYYTTTSSGAYTFRPSSQTAQIINNQTIKVQCVKGQFLDECRQKISNEISQIIKVYKDETYPYIEFDWLVGDLQSESSSGKEIITRFTIKDFNNSNIFYTDSNGREKIRRMLNYRSDYSYDSSEEPVTSNYYPVTSKILIRDEVKELEVAILNDRAQGGTSLENGVVELMIHRKLIRDDGLGVSEVLNEKQFGVGLYARGSHYLTFGSTRLKENEDISIAAVERDLALRKLLSPWVLVSDSNADATITNVENLQKLKFEGLKRSLPENVHILTLEPWINSYLLRLEHIFEKGEDPDLSQPVTVDLENLFTLFNITEVQETTLGANEILNSNVEDLKITLNPMQIRTFIIKTDANNEGGDDHSGVDDGGDDDDDGKNSSVRIAVNSAVAVIFLLRFILQI